ncbi:MAG: hypothetical protein JWN33_288 [Candidatus Saccharibacteria bacterium]|nr:hypothetical protein [Candidatus Saccharibacteria bacterium]
METQDKHLTRGETQKLRELLDSAVNIFVRVFDTTDPDTMVEAQKYLLKRGYFLSYAAHDAAFYYRLVFRTMNGKYADEVMLRILLDGTFMPPMALMFRRNNGDALQQYRQPGRSSVMVTDSDVADEMIRTFERRYIGGGFVRCWVPIFAGSTLADI